MESQQFSAVHARWPAWRATAGPVDYEESRCSNEIRMNVRLTLHLREMGVSVFIFILPSIYQRHSVNYCFIYLVTKIQAVYKPFAPVPGGGGVTGLSSTTSRCSVLMSMTLDHAVPGTACHHPLLCKPLSVAPLRARHQAWSLINDREIGGIIPN